MDTDGPVWRFIDNAFDTGWPDSSTVKITIDEATQRRAFQYVLNAVTFLSEKLEMSSIHRDAGEIIITETGGTFWFHGMLYIIKSKKWAGREVIKVLRLMPLRPSSPYLWYEQRNTDVQEVARRLFHQTEKVTW